MKSGLIFFSLIMVSCATNSKPYYDKNILAKNERALASREEGMVVCRRAELESCGVRLSDCSSQLKYECTPSVIILDISDLPQGYGF